MCEALIFLLDNIYIRFGIKLYKHTMGIPMGTNCAPIEEDLFLFCLSGDKEAEITEAFNSTSGNIQSELTGVHVIATHAQE